MVERSNIRYSPAERARNCNACNSECDRMSFYEVTRGIGGAALFSGWFCSYECYMKKKDEWRTTRVPIEVQDVSD